MDADPDADAADASRCRMRVISDSSFAKSGASWGRRLAKRLRESGVVELGLGSQQDDEGRRPAADVLALGKPHPEILIDSLLRRGGVAAGGSSRVRWGAKKLLGVLTKRHPTIALPARSTGNDILERHGMPRKRRRRKKWVHPGAAPFETTRPNQVWPADDQVVVRIETPG
jgi:hypothetical protein